MTIEIDKLREWFESEEGKKSIEKSIELERIRKVHQKRWLDRFAKRAESNVDAVLEKLINWYRSDRYRDREYALGYEPREDLLFLAFEYARKNCKECNDDEYWTPFTTEAYYIGSYVIQIIHGQGSAILIEKARKPKIKKKSLKEKHGRIQEIKEIIEDSYKSSPDPDSGEWAESAAKKIYSLINKMKPN